MDKNIVPHSYRISVDDRRKLNKHNSFLIWFTGLSGSGKSTLANELEACLHQKGIRTYTLDGDNIRSGINKDLTFSAEGRTENIRRIGEIAKLLVDSGTVTLAAFVSPYHNDRENVKQIVGPDKYVEVYVNTSLEACEERDVKGLYKKARLGEITNFTGISAPYEAPEAPDIIIRTEEMGISEAVENIMTSINKKLKL